MARSNIAGASGDIRFADIASLGSRWVAQRKWDGDYIRLALDSRGCIAAGYTSTGRIAALGDLIGVHAGSPLAQLVGEWVSDDVHLYDCLHDGTRDLRRTPYHARRDSMLRMVGAVQALDVDRPWVQDANRRKHSPRTGRFARIKPRSWRRVPVVEQMPPTSPEVGVLWERALAGEVEGLVLVNLDAPVSRTRAKLKCKPWSSIDCEVVRQDMSRTEFRWAGGVFSVGTIKRVPLWPGCWAEVRHHGYDKQGQPRHPTILRRRYDLEPGRVLELV